MSPEQLHQRNVRRAIDGIHKKTAPDTSGATVAVIGLDPDGFSFSKFAASRGFETIGFDADEVKVAQLEAQEDAPLRTLSITSEISELRGADIFVLCAPAPIVNGKPDLSSVEAATAIVARSMKSGSLVILATDVPPGVSEHIILPILEKGSELMRPGSEGQRAEFFFAHAPKIPDVIAQVIGAADQESLSRALSFYRTSLGYDVIPMRSLKEAEAVSLFERAKHDQALALEGEFAMLFDRIGVDIVAVANAASGRKSAVHRSPLKHPRFHSEAYYVTRSGHEHEIEGQLLTTGRRVIEHMPEYAVKVLSEAMREKHISLKGSTVALLGLSDDEPSFELSLGARIRDSLVKKGATVHVFDPYVSGAGRDLKETLTGAQAVLIAGDDPMFCNLTPRQFEEFGVAIVIDARNCLDKDSFARSSVVYRGIGRG